MDRAPDTAATPSTTVLTGEETHVQKQGATPPAPEAEMLPNRKFYGEIDGEMGRLEQPTVKNAIDAMQVKGSDIYFRAFPYHRNGKSFLRDSIRHDLVHIAVRAGHTPQMEMIELAFEFGFIAGSDARHFTPKELQKFAEKYAVAEARFLKDSEAYTDKKPALLSKRDTAIYMAAGMYLRDKFDALRHGSAWMEDYATQKDFCDRYALHDSAPVTLTETHRFLSAKREYAHLFEDAPYALLALNKEEWRAIEGVALGMRAPEQTPYPQRMAAIQEALVKVGVFHDRPAYVAKLAAEKDAQQNMRVVAKNVLGMVG